MKYKLISVILLSLSSLQLEAVTIDKLTIGDLGSSSDYNASSGFSITPWRDRFFRSDGINYRWGAGSTSIGKFKLASTRVSGSEIFFEFDASSADYLTRYTDFSFGDYGSSGTILPFGNLMIVAELGGAFASIVGEAQIGASGTGYPPPRGAVYTSPVGSIIPFRVDYQLVGDTWDENQFSSSFRYQSSGLFDFANYRAVPDTSSTVTLLFASMVFVFLSRSKFVAK